MFVCGCVCGCRNARSLARLLFHLFASPAGSSPAAPAPPTVVATAYVHAHPPLPVRSPYICRCIVVRINQTVLIAGSSTNSRQGITVGGITAGIVHTPPCKTYAAPVQRTHSLGADGREGGRRPTCTSAKYSSTPLSFVADTTFIPRPPAPVRFAVYPWVATVTQG